MNKLQTDILHKIKAGYVSMKPKWQFVLKASLFFSGLVVVSLLVLYLMSFVLFFLRQSGVFFSPGFGLRGVSFFLMSSPWLLIIVTVIFLVLLYTLVKKYSFSYQRPLLYSMVGVVLVTVLGAWLVGETSVHHRIGSFTERNEVPLFSPLYRGALGERPEGLVAGTIADLTDTGFVLESERGETLEVIVNADTRRRPSTELEVGDVVMVFGDRNENTITAFGIRPYDEGQHIAPRWQKKQKGTHFTPPVKQLESDNAPSIDRPLYLRDE